MLKKQTVKLNKVIIKTLTEKGFLKGMNMKTEEMHTFLEDNNLQDVITQLLTSSHETKRFNVSKVSEIIKPVTEKLSPEPEEGWPQYIYDYVLSTLFPEKIVQHDDNDLHLGRLFFTQILRALYRYERETVEFDPTIDIKLPKQNEMEQGGYTWEYKRLEKLIHDKYIYEFMRIGADITPYNTLGHIAGVHYVAMYIAKQLEFEGVPVDMGLVSGAAAGHDIGKYGCKKSEERRIPYLHYYYTNICFNRFDMPMTGYIAANHSTWDLELENLSVESLILIYSDFRVKSSRNSQGVEEVNFYSLKESFNVILAKLDNVDEAKELRYRKVYNKLKDFEDYMRSVGVNTCLPEKPGAFPQEDKPEHIDAALLNSHHVVERFKHAAMEHNIGLMNCFYREDKFGNLLETARSEKQWRNLRTYISILGEYSTYMTEKQKTMTLRFLYELLAHKESDIRNQAGEIMGQIIAGFNDEYKKELPEGVHLSKKKITNSFLWQSYIKDILLPDHKLADQHKKWIGNSLKNVTHGLMENCDKEQRDVYLNALISWFSKKDLTYRIKEALLRVGIIINPEYCNEQQKLAIVNFADKIEKNDEIELKTEAIRVKYHYNHEWGKKAYISSLKNILKIEEKSINYKESLSDIYLDNLKAQTPWSIKVANIAIMLDFLDTHPDDGEILHVATHLGNLIKVSETVTVRRAAGEALLKIIGKMPLEQRNEIAVELGKGLEIGDYQFSKYIPSYLGVIMLYLPPRELDELITDLEKFLEAGSSKVAVSVMHTFGIVLENYGLYRKYFPTAEGEEKTLDRKWRILNIVMRGFAHYDNLISQESFWTIGTQIFGSQQLSNDEKYLIFCRFAKKLLTIYESIEEDNLDFFNNAAVFNHIYRFICQFELERGSFEMKQKDKVAFFPGTFDPFSLSHKAIATEIRNSGYEVYLALDEFSWSKKTQPRLQRRKIMSMSIADEEDMYIFPDDIPINIANPMDLKKLKEVFNGRSVYFVAGSDVIANASCYKATPVEDSIHSINHIIFKRASSEIINEDGKSSVNAYPLTGEVIYLSLPEHLEDISSTLIRENIDSNRDITSMLDSVSQNYIYDRGLYLREPTYKYVIQSMGMSISCSEDENTRTIKVTIHDGRRNNTIVGEAQALKVDSKQLLDVFGTQEIAAYIRNKASGNIALINNFKFSKKTSIECLGQVLLVEILSELIARDFAYVIYYPQKEMLSDSVVDTIRKQGFVNIAQDGKSAIYAADVKSPIILFKNVETIIKSPLNKNPRVLKAVEKAHDRLLNALSDIYPGQILLSYNAGVMHYKLINLISRLNGVPAVQSEKKQYGPYMAVPFGKVLEGAAVPNTVTKALHTEKYFSKDTTTFTVEESEYYSPLNNQIKTIKSFRRPVILVDDLLHKGYRMKKLDPLLKQNDIQVVDTVVGVLTGRGRDLMSIKERTADSAYFLPNLNFWIDETACYPFIGGDSMKEEGVKVSVKGNTPSLNLILPYAVPSFLGQIPDSKVYDYSMVCLENARDILKVLEVEYQNRFERKLTLSRFGEVVVCPKKPDLGANLDYDYNIAPSAYVDKDIEKLVRLKKMFV